MTGTIAIIVVLGGLIFFHELGHFLAARALKIGVKKFSIGFGPKLFGIQGKQTLYQVALVPLGGFVSLVGENGKDEEIPAPFTPGQSFSLRPPLHRLLVVLAGPFFNLLMAWFIYSALFLGGQMIIPEVGKVAPESPAALAGIVPGERIVAINGRQIGRWDDIRMRVNMGSMGAAQPLLVEVENGGASRELEITPAVTTFTDKSGKEFSLRQLGLLSAGAPYEGGFFASLLEGARETWRGVLFIGDTLFMLGRGEVPVKDMGGPIFIGQIVHEQASNSAWLPLLTFAALLSLNLALLNLLPIPALDGGHVFFNLIELIFRRPVPEKVQAYGTAAGLALVLLLSVFLVFNDIGRLLKFWG